MGKNEIGLLATNSLAESLCCLPVAGCRQTILLCDAKYLGPDGISILSLTLHGTLGRSGP